jgi:Catalytic LigB subunit of aromatic ring-opening dioxygenase
MISRRALLAGTTALVTATTQASADTGRARVIFVSHGEPLFLPGQDARRQKLAAWGARLPKPRGIVVMTPHFASRTMQVGATGRGFAGYDLPGHMQRLLPQDLEYATPPSEALAARIDALLGAALERAADRRGFDHTTWMPLKCLFPSAEIPVLEIAYPYIPERDAFALGRRLEPLREEGTLFVASGGMTHNLAMGTEGGVSPFGQPLRSRELTSTASSTGETKPPLPILRIPMTAPIFAWLSSPSASPSPEAARHESRFRWRPSKHHSRRVAWNGRSGVEDLGSTLDGIEHRQGMSGASATESRPCLAWFTVCQSSVRTPPRGGKVFGLNAR